MYDFNKFKQHIEKTENWFKEEISLLRTGRATPTLVENIKVDYYGSKTPLKNVASISAEDAKTLAVKPWEPDMVIPIEQGISASNLGVQAIGETGMVRVVFPELTEERRTALLKVLNEKLEEAKISLRKEREETKRDIQKKQKEGEFGEDDSKRSQDELQKLIEGATKDFEELAKKKEEEIRK